MDQNLEALLQQYTPEQLAQLLGLGTLDERGGLLDKQAEQAKALATPNHQPYTTGTGAAIGAVGDVLGGLGGGIAGLLTADKQKGLLNQKDAARLEYLRGMRAKPPGPAQPQTQSLPGPTPGSAGAGDIPLDGLFRYG